MEPIFQPHDQANGTMMRPTIRNGSRLGVIEIHSDGLEGPRYIPANLSYNSMDLNKSHNNVKIRYLPSGGGPHNLQLATEWSDYSHLGITRRAADDSDEVWADE
ncbi:hypothetical protein FRB94_001888 [Tulasnella sp. JGI-2019a]|nr:hypothetical protein FRB94_001888 [Tulasnella sp. JGI-2019a]